MSYEKSCGAVVFRKYHGNIELLLIKHVVGGHWSFPKGHVEPVSYTHLDVYKRQGGDIPRTESGFHGRNPAAARP